MFSKYISWSFVCLLIFSVIFNTYSIETSAQALSSAKPIESRNPEGTIQHVRAPVRRVKLNSDSELGLYILKSPINTSYVGDTEEAVCAGYQSFYGKFGELMKFDELNKFANKGHVSFYTYGLPIGATGKSCIVAESKFYDPPKLISMMDYRLVLMANDAVGDKYVAEYFSKVNGAKFFSSTLNLRKVDKILCKWNVDLAKEGTWIEGVTYHSVAQGRKEVHQEFQTIADLLARKDKMTAMREYLSDKVKDKVALERLLAVDADEITIDCDYSAILHLETPNTLMGEQISFSCKNEKCELNGE